MSEVIKTATRDAYGKALVELGGIIDLTPDEIFFFINENRLHFQSVPFIARLLPPSIAYI